MATTSTTPHPIFRELGAILGDRSVSICPDNTEFKKCQGLVDDKGKKRQCHKPIASSEATEDLHEMLRGVTNWSDAETDNVKSYLQKRHCWVHQKGVDAKFDKWVTETPQNRLAGSRNLGLGDDPDVRVQEQSSDMDKAPPSSPRPSLEGQAGSATQKTAPLPTDPAIVESLGALTIDASQQRNVHVTQKSVDIVETTDFRMVGLGLARAAALRRQVSVRDRSPLMQEIYKHLTLTEQKPGVVYILRHLRIPELWKIGWTSRSAEERLGDSHNCYGKAGRVLYQTQGGSFSGANKAEKLAHAFLRENNLHVTECEWCGKGHGEWFQGPEDKVRDAVTLMENLVKLPGYVLQDGKMRLSTEIHALLDKTWEMSMDKLSELLATTKETKEQTLSSLDTEVNGTADAIGKLDIDAGPGSSRMLVTTTSEAVYYQSGDVADVSATLPTDTSATIESPVRQPGHGGLTELPRIQGDVGFALPSAAPDMKSNGMSDAISELGIDAGPGIPRMLVTTTSEASYHQSDDVADVSATLPADTSAAIESPLRQPDDGGLAELPRIQDDVSPALPSAAPDVKRGKIKKIARGVAKPLAFAGEIQANVKAAVQEPRALFDVFIDEIKDAVQERQDSKGSRRTSSGRLSFGFKA